MIEDSATVVLAAGKGPAYECCFLKSDLTPFCDIVLYRYLAIPGPESWDKRSNVFFRIFFSSSAFHVRGFTSCPLGISKLGVSWIDMTVPRLMSILVVQNPAA